MSGFTIPGLAGATALSLLANSSAIASWTPPAPPPDPPAAIVWDGPPSQELLTVVPNTQMMSEGARFAPFAIGGDVFVTGGPFTRPAVWTDYDPTFSEYTYVLVTGDTTVGRNTRVGHPSHRLRHFRVGQQAKHVYNQPGTYTFQWYVYARDGRWGKSAPTTITVTTPEVRIPAARTIVVSNTPGESWAGAPAHDVANRCTTLQAALARFNTLKSGGSVRISIKPGAVINEMALTPLASNFRFTTGRWLVDTWVPGQRATIDPAINWTGGTPNAPPTFKDIRMVYAWDRMRDMRRLDRPTQSLGGPLVLHWLSEVHEPNHHTIFDNCDVVGTLGQVVYSPENFSVLAACTFFNDTKLEDLGNYISLDCMSIAFLNSWTEVPFGGALGQMGRARMGGEFEDFGQSHNSMRMWRRTLYVDGSDLEGRGGWSGQSSGSSAWDHQAIIRSAATSGFPGQRNYFARSVMIGSIQLGGDGSQTIFDGNVICFDPAQRFGEVCSGSGGGHIYRNNFFVVVPGPKNMGVGTGRNMSKFEVGFDPGSFTTCIGLTNQAPTANRPFEMLHNTFIIYRNTAGYPAAPTITSGTLASGVTFRDGHNVLYAPDHGTVPAGGVSFIEQPSWSILDVWVKNGWERQTHTLAADLGPSQQTPLIPYPNEFRGTPTTQEMYAGAIDRHGFRLFQANQGYPVVTTLPPDGSSVGRFVIWNGTVRIWDGIEWVESGFNAIYYSSPQGSRANGRSAFSISLEPNGFRLTNTSATRVFPAGVRLDIMLDRGSTLEDALTIWQVDQTKKRLVRPNTPVALTAGQPRCMFDFAMNLRRGAGFAISPSTGPADCAGALLPAA